MVTALCGTGCFRVANTGIDVLLLNPFHEPCERVIFTPLLQMRKLGLREVK